MDNKVDKATKESSKYLIILEKYLRTQKKGASISQIVVATGLATHWVEPSLRKLMGKYACQVEFNAQKELVYIFDFSHLLRETLFKAFVINVLQFTLQALFFTILLLWKLIGLIYFLVYICTIFMLSMLTLPFFIMGYPFFRLAFGKKIHDKVSNIYDYSVDGVGEVIDKLFGVGLWDIPDFFKFKIRKKDRLAIEKQLLEYVSAYGGKIVETDIIKITGWSLDKVKEEVTQLVANYRGEIEVNQEGIIQYVFSELTGQGETEEEDVLWIWQKPIQIKVIDNAFLKRLLWAFLYANILLAVPMFFLFLASEGEFISILPYVAFPFYPYLFGFVVLGIKKILFSIQNIPARRKYKHYQILKDIFERITEEKEEILFSKTVFLEKWKDSKLINKIILDYEAEQGINEKGNSYFSIPKFEEELIWRQNQTSERNIKVVFEDNFKNNKNEWIEGDDENKKLKVGKGYYLFQHKRDKNSWYTQRNIEIDNTKDFEIEVIIEQKEGRKYNFFGLAWGKLDSNNQYNIVMNSNQKYMIDETQNGKYIEQQSWTRLAEIRPYTKNKIRVRRYKNNLKYYINDVLIYKTNFEGFYGDNIAFIVDKNMTVKIHHLKVVEFDNVVGQKSKEESIENKNQKPNRRHYEVIFEDDFMDNKHKWSEGENDNRKLKIQHGYYLFYHKRKEKDSSWFTHKEIEIDSRKDFEIETIIEQENGNKKNYFGLIWGKLDNDNQYNILINSNQKYMIDETREGKYITWKSWTKQDEILPYTKNTIRVVKKKSNLKYYINEVLVYKTSFQAFYGQKIGFILDKNMTIKIHKLSVIEFYI